MNTLSDLCDRLPGVGKTLAGKLAQCGIHTVQDLLFHLPYRYQDRTRITTIQDLRVNDWCVIVGRVCKTEIIQGKRMILCCFIEDKTGVLCLRFFHFNKQQIKQLNESKQIRAFGEVKAFSNTLNMIHPEYQLFDGHQVCPVEETLTPIYSTTQGLSQNKLRQLVKFALIHYKQAIENLEWMNPDELKMNHLYALPQAIEVLHNPPPDTAIQALEEGQHPGLKRLVIDELLAQRFSMQFARQQRRQLVAPMMQTHPNLIDCFVKQLPFTLTEAQERVYREVQQDLTQSKPMLRLIQGDVGSGKTVICALAAIQAIANGYQVALMAPTEILSEQHTHTLQAWLTPLKIQVLRLTGKMSLKERRATLKALANHQVQLIIGTHALFQQDVSFAKLGLIMIDEQHRFGVEQRSLLQQKGQQAALTPHQLLLTATPIPRTLAMTQFAHIDLSAIDERPPGRTPVITAVINQNKRDLIIERLKSAIVVGRQVYWVCTLIEDSEKQQCMAAVETARHLKTQLPNARIGLVHGRLKATEKETIMLDFKRGDLDLLVATTVIEVGVDVANASLMIIENAERLGLSQLHQLRGRVGRGTIESHCLLLYQPPLGHQSHERLSTMRATNDGFMIAEKDLQLRGSGEFLGTRQTGYRPFKITNLQRDQALLTQIDKLANGLFNQQPEVARTIAERWLGDFERFMIT